MTDDRVVLQPAHKRDTHAGRFRPARYVNIRPGSSSARGIIFANPESTASKKLVAHGDSRRLEKGGYDMRSCLEHEAVSGAARIACGVRPRVRFQCVRRSSGRLEIAAAASGFDHRRIPGTRLAANAAHAATTEATTKAT